MILQQKNSSDIYFSSMQMEQVHFTSWSRFLFTPRIIGDREEEEEEEDIFFCKE